MDCFTSLCVPEIEPVLATIEKSISEGINVVSESGNRSVILVLDSPDVLIALNVTRARLLDAIIMRLRSLTHATLITCFADLPRLTAASNPLEFIATPVETEGAAFLIQQAHAARQLMSVRSLETGAAKDVSGVLRVTRGGGSYESEEDGLGVYELEVLYFVQKDGLAKVFERGADS